jgi:hypothetical protein
VNTEKGRKLFDDCSENLNVYPVDIEKLIEDGVIFSGGTKRPAGRDRFVEDYSKMELSALADKYVPSKRYIKMRVYYSLPRAARAVIKKYVGD